MNYRILIPLLSLFLCIGCAKPITLVTNIEHPESSFEELLKKEIEHSKGAISGVSLTVFAPDQNIKWTGAEGYDSANKTKTLSIAQPFRIASITKTFVATAILRLYEEEKIALENPISDYISDEHQSILVAGGYVPSMINIRQCLQHTSGLFDYAMGSDSYIKVAKKNPKKRWTRTEQLQFAMDHGKPIGKPGEKYHYSDTGYIILGEIIEKTTGTSLAEGLRTLIGFDTLDLSSTWLESLEPRPKGLPTSVHRYMGTIDASHWDNSVDLYGGGGLSSTTGDLAIFFHSLFNHSIFKKPETLAIMLQPSEAGVKDQENYRMGINQLYSERYKIEGFFHDGFWNSVAVHIPEYNCTISINYTNGFSNNVLIGAIGIVKKIKESKKRTN